MMPLPVTMPDDKAIVARIVMAGLVPAIHVFAFTAEAERRGCPATQTSLRSLRKTDCYGRA
jgi:hypothetical protein